LAAFLEQRGYTILGDDICPVRVYPGPGAVAFPGFPRLKLWAEALEALGLNPSDFPQLRSEIEKHELTTRDRIAEPFVPLRRLYVLCETRDLERDPRGVETVEGAARLGVLLAHTYRFRYLNGFGRKPEHLRTCAAVLKSISVFRLWRPWDFSRMPETLDALETHWNDMRDKSVELSQALAAA
jgi:hypothetical protein